MHFPTTFDELKKYTAENTQESIYLDYKRSAAISAWSQEQKIELAKDVSAFANSGGGVLIYGAVERDIAGIPCFDSFDGGLKGSPNIEAIEDVLTSEKYIHKKITDLIIKPILDSASGGTYVIISIPRSLRAPHMHNPSTKFYKRHNFKSEPMQGYEVEDIRNRTDAPRLSVHINRIKRDHGDGSVHHYRTGLIILNDGNRSLKNYQFEFAVPHVLRDFFNNASQGHRETTIDGHKYLAMYDRYCGDDYIMFPGQGRQVLDLSYMINHEAYSLISKPMPPPRWNIYSDNSPVISGIIDWNKLQEY